MYHNYVKKNRRKKNRIYTSKKKKTALNWAKKVEKKTLMVKLLEFQDKRLLINSFCNTTQFAI
jgi:hypothetical protein